MRNEEIVINYDARKFEVLAQHYEGTLEGFIEYELDNLYDEVVPPELAYKIKADQEIEIHDCSENRFALIHIKDGDDEIFVTTSESKTLVDIANNLRNIYIQIWSATLWIRLKIISVMQKPLAMLHLIL